MLNYPILFANESGGYYASIVIREEKDNKDAPLFIERARFLTEDMEIIKGIMSRVLDRTPKSRVIKGNYLEENKDIFLKLGAKIDEDSKTFHLNGKDFRHDNFNLKEVL